MRRFTRLAAATLVAGVAVAAATALIADPASGAGSASAGSQLCGRDTPTLTNRSGSAPTLTRAGEFGSVPVTLRNPGHAAVADARLTLSVSGDRGHRAAAAPALRWRFDGGPWHQAVLHRTFGRGYASGPMALPRVAAGSTHTLRLAVAFRSDDPSGSYTVRAVLRTGRCVSSAAFAQASVAFAPARLPSPTPSHKPGKHTGTRGPGTAGHPSAGTGAAGPANRPTPSPSASGPSPSSSPSPMPGATTLGGGPVAPIPTGAAADRALSDPIAGASRAALLIGGVGALFIGASAAALVYLRRRRLI